MSLPMPGQKFKIKSPDGTRFEFVITKVDFEAPLGPYGLADVDITASLACLPKKAKRK